MKPKLIYIFIVVTLLSFSSCKEEKLDEESIFDSEEVMRNEFDKWLLKNYTYPYNIDFKYKMEDIESDMQYSLVPAEIEKARTLAKIVKYVWLEAYDEVAGINFTRKYVPKMIHLVGSAAYNNDFTMVLGTAEGGLKITLYLVNSLVIDPDFLNYYYFKTMHHEFAHILNQTKNYDPDFEKVSEADYIGGDWHYDNENTALEKGFISPYAQSEPVEDFVENIATFVTNTPEEWNQKMLIAGTEGAEKINLKFDIVKKYMEDSWDIDIVELRNAVQRRTEKLQTVDFNQL